MCCDKKGRSVPVSERARWSRSQAVLPRLPFPNQEPGLLEACHTLTERRTRGQDAQKVKRGGAAATRQKRKKSNAAARRRRDKNAKKGAICFPPFVLGSYLFGSPPLGGNVRGKRHPDLTPAAFAPPPHRARSRTWFAGSLAHFGRKENTRTRRVRSQTRWRGGNATTKANQGANCVPRFVLGSCMFG